jgi:hypothetical protein
MRKEIDQSNMNHNNTSNFEIQTKPKVIDMNKIFTDLFNSQGYNNNNQFLKKDVWFLKQDNTFQNMTLFTTVTRGENKIIYDILKDLSDNYLVKRIDIEYTKFIQAVCEKLYLAQETIDRCQVQIDLYKAHENINIIEGKIKILEEMKGNVMYDHSTIEFSIQKCEPDTFGGLEYIMNYSEMDQYDPTITENKKLNLKFKPYIKFTAIEAHYNNNNNYNNFHTLDSLFNTNSFSGTTFSQFKILAFRKGELCGESSTENFLLMLLSYLKELKEIEKPTLFFSWKVNMKVLNVQEEGDSEFDLTLDFKIVVDSESRIAMLKKIHKVLKDAISTQTVSENVKKEILEYFPEISQSVMTVLERKDDQVDNHDCACSSCTIF